MRLPFVLCRLLVCLVPLVLPPAVGAQLPDHPRVGRGPIPGWVRDLAVDPAATLGVADADVSYLLVDYQARVPRRREPERFYRQVYRLESRGALEGWSSREIPFEPTYQRVRVHHLRIHRDGAWSDRLATSRAQVLHREDDRDRQIYDHRLDLVLVLDDVRVGDVVDAAYSIEGSNPVFGGHFVDRINLGWSRPIAHLHRRYLAAPERGLRFKVHAGGGEPERRETAEGRETVWDLRDVEEIDAESGTPDDWSDHPWAQVSEFGSWAEVVAWGLPLYGEPGDHPALGLAAETLRATADAGDLIAAARDWVQGEIRYFAVPMGEHSHAPHGVAEILERRYGDCKDKSLVLVELLRRLGIDAWPAFVHTGYGGALGDWLPSPTDFNHVIVAAESDGQTLWIDPTMTLQGGRGDALYVPRYQLALEVRPGARELSAMADAQSRLGTSSATYEYLVSPPERGSEVTITQELDHRYAEGIRRTLATVAPDELLESYVDFYLSDRHTVEPAAELEIADDRPANRVTITERYRLTYTPSDEGTATFFASLPLVMESDLGSPDPGDRQTPFALPYPLHRVETVILRAADWDLRPVEAEEENPWFRFTASSEPLAGGLRVRYELETLTDRVEPGDAEDYRAAVGRMDDELGYSMWWNDEDLRGFALLCLFAGALAVGAVYGLFFLALRHHGLIEVLSDG